jgi:hypothetical protein
MGNGDKSLSKRTLLFERLGRGSGAPLAASLMPRRPVSRELRIISERPNL